MGARSPDAPPTSLSSPSLASLARPGAQRAPGARLADGAPGAGWRQALHGSVPEAVLRGAGARRAACAPCAARRALFRGAELQLLFLSD